MAVGTKVHGGVNLTGTSVRERHRIGPSRGRWRSLAGLSLTQGTGRLLRQALDRFELGRPRALGLDGLGWGLGSSTGWTRPEGGEHDAQPQQDEDHQLIVDEVWMHRMAPLHRGEREPFYPVFEPSELSARSLYTTPYLRSNARASSRRCGR
jgi:hypothetical protein